MSVAIDCLDEDDAAALQALPPVLAALAVSARPDGRIVYAAVQAGETPVWSLAHGDGHDERLPQLTPSQPPADRRWQLVAVPCAVAELCGSSTDRVAVAALTAGLLQINDWLDESHQASQAIEGAGPARSGDYWHAIMHRREPDYGNARYWFRHVGRHPVMSRLPASAERILTASGAGAADRWLPRLVNGGLWEPFAFVDLCQTVAREQSSPLGRAARRLQWTEMLQLLAYCWMEAGAARHPG